MQLIPNCFEKKDRFPFNNTATVNTSFYLTSFRYRGLFKWSHAMMKYFRFVSTIFSTLFVKVLCQNIFSFVNEPQRRASPEFATLGSTSLALKLSNLWTHERLFDEWSTGEKMHVEIFLTKLARKHFIKSSQLWFKLCHRAKGTRTNSFGRTELKRGKTSEVEMGRLV